jgi:hypothetical protein
MTESGIKRVSPDLYYGCSLDITYNAEEDVCNAIQELQTQFKDFGRIPQMIPPDELF